MTERASLYPDTVRNCFRCGKAIVWGGPYELRLELTNAAKAAPKAHVLVEGAFHAECAAMVFRIAKGNTEEAPRV